MNRRPLAIIVGSAAHDRLHAALSLAAASAALGREISVYLHAEAVRIADPAAVWDEDTRFAAAGAPTLRELIDSAVELGVAITACQTGLALAGLSAESLKPGITAGGLIDYLSRAGGAEIMLG